MEVVRIACNLQMLILKLCNHNPYNEHYNFETRKVDKQNNSYKNYPFYDLLVSLHSSTFVNDFNLHSLCSSQVRK